MSKAQHASLVSTNPQLDPDKDLFGDPLSIYESWEAGFLRRSVRICAALSEYVDRFLEQNGSDPLPPLFGKAWVRGVPHTVSLFPPRPYLTVPLEDLDLPTILNDQPGVLFVDLDTPSPRFAGRNNPIPQTLCDLASSLSTLVEHWPLQEGQHWEDRRTEAVPPPDMARAAEVSYVDYLSNGFSAGPLTNYGPVSPFRLDNNISESGVLSVHSLPEELQPQYQPGRVYHRGGYLFVRDLRELAAALHRVKEADMRIQGIAIAVSGCVPDFTVLADLDKTGDAYWTKREAVLTEQEGLGPDRLIVGTTSIPVVLHSSDKWKDRTEEGSSVHGYAFGFLAMDYNYESDDDNLVAFIAPCSGCDRDFMSDTYRLKLRYPSWVDSPLEPGCKVLFGHVLPDYRSAGVASPFTGLSTGMVLMLRALQQRALAFRALCEQKAWLDIRVRGLTEAQVLLNYVNGFALTTRPEEIREFIDARSSQSSYLWRQPWATLDSRDGNAWFIPPNHLDVNLPDSLTELLSRLSSRYSAQTSKDTGTGTCIGEDTSTGLDGAAAGAAGDDSSL